MKQWTVLLIPLVAYWMILETAKILHIIIILDAGDNPCTLRAIANIGNRQQDMLSLQLQCGSITCPQALSFSCDNIHDVLNISKQT